MRTPVATCSRSRMRSAFWAIAGVTVVTDTCTYITPILHDIEVPVMTNSAKWAWYAPTNLGFDVVFGSLEECVRSASLGRVWRETPELSGRAV